MTCIAYRHGVLAADTCVTVSVLEGKTEIPRSRLSVSKIHITPVTPFSWLALAAAGDDEFSLMYAGHVSKILERIMYGEAKTDGFPQAIELRPWPKIMEEEMEGSETPDTVLITGVVGTGGPWAAYYGLYGQLRLIEAYYSARGRVPGLIPDGYVAIGSDQLAALGAMSVGASAIEGVVAACKHGTYSSLPIEAVSHHDFVKHTVRVAEVIPVQAVLEG